MATQVTLFPFNSLSVAEMPVAVMADTAPGSGDNGRPPAQVVVQDPGVDLAKKTVCIKMRLSTMATPAKSRRHRSRRMPTRTCCEYRSICWIQRS